ncbi:MAG: FecR domain-containing protein [Chitinophagaceae bacterium]
MQIPQNILILIEKYLAGSATEEERSIVNNWYQSFPDENVEIATNEIHSKEQIELRIKERLLATISENEKRKGINKWWMRSAAAILLIGVAVYFFIASDNTKQNTTVAEVPVKQTEEIVPGGNKAMLTLADGSTIILDSAANGLLSQQGGIKVQKLDNGLLAYTINGKLITENDQAFYNTITTPRGGQYQVTLSDGTQVWLNASSSIHFPVVFAGAERKVEITGEAYFEVAKNLPAGRQGTTMPFKVITGSSEVEVLGTHFNINSYADEASVKTTLLEGLVKVSVTGDNQSSKFLKAGQQTTVNKDGRISVLNNADLEEAVAWKNGRFQFNSADLKSILRQISRWYDVDVEYRGNVDIHFTGQLPRNDNVNKVFDKLALTGEVHFKVEGKKIIVSR